MSLIVVGSVAFDAIATPFGQVDKIIGGSGTYGAISASFFSKNVRLVGVVGGDFPKTDIQRFQNRGIDTTGLQIKEDQKSFFWSGKYHNDMNSRDTLITELNVLGNFDPVIPQAYQGSNYLMLGNLAPSVQALVIKRLSKRPKLVLMDTMNFWINSAPDDLAEVLTMVDVLSINDEEARMLSKEYSLVKAAQKILKMGPKALIIKKGEHGALLINKEQIFFAPALPLEDVFDPTGAGDTFAGGFMGYLAHTDEISFENMKRAIIYGSALASFCVEKFGPERILDLTEDELDSRVQQFVDLVQFEIELT
jgi:sugar/nucleoside kinase (ribokinase family)